MFLSVQRYLFFSKTVYIISILYLRVLLLRTTLRFATVHFQEFVSERLTHCRIINHKIDNIANIKWKSMYKLPIFECSFLK